MTEAEKRGCERIARLFAAGTGHPLIVPPSLLAELKRQGVDVSNVRAPQPIP